MKARKLGEVQKYLESALNAAKLDPSRECVQGVDDPKFQQYEINEDFLCHTL